jgi:hypothetical protein
LLNAKELDSNGEIVTFSVNKHDKSVGYCEVMKAGIIGGGKTASSGKDSNSGKGTSRSNGQQQQRQKQQHDHHHQQRSAPPEQKRESHQAAHVSVPTQEIMAPEKPEFIDYLTGGCQISLAVAIDFTASNGDPRQEGTPHYFHPPASKEWNDYEKAIFAVGSILAKYDADQRFPVWGFGAKYNNVVRHCFQCGNEVEVEGVQGIMDAYRGVFRTPLTMSYPTKFTEVISTAASYARHEHVRLFILEIAFVFVVSYTVFLYKIWDYPHSYRPFCPGFLSQNYSGGCS